MKKLIFKLLFSVLSLITLNLFGQSVVLDTNNVKKPKSGGLYYQKKDKTLYLFRQKFEVVNKPQIQVITEVPKEDFFEKEIGSWNVVPGSILVVKNIDQKLWLFQTDKNRTFYVFRGKNFIAQQDVKLSETIDLSKLSSELTEIGGLMPAINGNIPKGFNLEKWKNAGFKLNSKGEWVLNLVVDETNDNNNNNTESQISENKIKFSPDETRLDVLDWTKIEDFKLPNTWKNIAGFGVPVTGKEVPTADGKYLAFHKGFTNYVGMLELGLKRYSPDNRYIFDSPARLIALAAQQLIGHIEGKAFAEYPNGYYASGVWGDIKRLLAKQDVCDYSGLTEAGTAMIGKYCYYQWWTQDVDTREELWPTHAWVLMDEEHIGDYGGIGKFKFLSIINQEIKKMQPNINLAWFASPMHYFYHSNLDPEKIKDEDIQKFHLDAKTTNYSDGGFKNIGFWFDAGGYSGVPHITKNDKYERNADGSFKILNGKRVYSSKNFTETIYGEKTDFLAEPADWLKYRVDTPNEGIKVSSAYFDANGNLKAEYVAKGWHDRNARKKSFWEPETKKATEAVYAFADITLTNILIGNQLEYNSTDISSFKADSKINPYLELRFVTEGGGWGSNSMVSRHKGKELTTFEVLFSYLSGVKATSIFGEGRGYKPGGDIEAISWGSLIHRQEAIRQLSKDLEGTDQRKWRFIHFYYPVALNNRRGVIGVGIYTGEKFVYCLANPSLNYDENQTVELSIDGKKNNIVINGADLYNYNVISNLKQGLDGTNFNLTYKTIYGKQIKVSGVFDGVLKNTLIEEK